MTRVFGGCARVDPLRLAGDLAGSAVFGLSVAPQWHPVESRRRAGDGSELASAAAVTVTLGKLYFDQGHLDEAERIFRQVLDGTPNSSRASEGLEAVAAARRCAEEPAPDSRQPVRASRRTRRKVERLERFLRQLSRPLPGSA
jgi:hypothetical protein